MKFSAEEPKAAPAKPRRMQGEPEAPPGSYHALEHDENSTCSMHPVCIPVATPPPALPQMPKLEISAQFAHQIADRSAAWVKDWIAYESSLREHRARMEEALADIAWKDGALTAAIKQVYALQRALRDIEEWSAGF